MKMISMLIALLIVGYLAQKQLGSTSTINNAAVEDAMGGEGVSSVDVPTSLEDVKQLEVDLNKLVQDNVDKKAIALGELLEN